MSKIPPGVERAVCTIADLHPSWDKFDRAHARETILKHTAADLMLELCKSITEKKYGSKQTDFDYQLARRIQAALGKGSPDGKTE